MSTPVGARETRALPKPVGHVQPAADRAVRAVAALRAGRLDDAGKHIAAIEESSAIERAWKLFLEGRLACERGGFATAEAPLRQAVAIALESALSQPQAGGGADEAFGGACNADAFRLAAVAYEAIGLSLRRQDRPAEAYRAHLIARRLRDEHGSSDEQWESAISLGLAGALARDARRAEKWYRDALTIAERAAETPVEKRAIAWTHLSALFTDGARLEEAVAAARTARDLWREHDIGSLAAARADVHLACALILLGESLVEVSAPKAASAVRDAMDILEVAGEALNAFGPPAAADSARCDELVDFARRLLAMCQA